MGWNQKISTLHTSNITPKYDLTRAEEFTLPDLSSTEPPAELFMRLYLMCVLDRDAMQLDLVVNATPA